MALAGVLILCLLVLGCINISNHLATGGGETTQEGYSKSEDTQSASDTTTELQSKVSGIDASQNELTETINKQTEMLKDTRERDRAIDINNPELDKEERKKIYKRDR